MGESGKVRGFCATLLRKCESPFHDRFAVALSGDTRIPNLARYNETVTSSSPSPPPILSSHLDNYNITDTANAAHQHSCFRGGAVTL